MSTASAVGVIGCLGTSDTTTGLVLRKSIDVEVTSADGNPVRTDLLNVIFEQDENILHGSYDPEYIASAIDERFVTVSDDLHEALRNQFQDVRYLANVESTEGDKTPVNTAATQTAFNELTLGGVASVSTTWGDDGFGYLRVHNTEPRNQAVSDSNITPFDLDARVNSE
ncbi:hypothetical protein GCM10009000_093040 [Halobacterium noricense]